MKAFVCALLFFVSPLSAVIFVVPDGETETETLELPNEGDEALIEEGGTIDVTGNTVVGVDMLADNQKVVNKGTINTDGTAADGIQNNASNNGVILNSGTINTNGDAADGIENANRNNVTIVNSGMINANGNGADGILNFNADNTVITNSGTINTNGNDTNGIENASTSNNTVITNSGTINTNGSDANGIENTFNTNNTVITNSGIIKSADAFALNLQGDNQTLNLLRGSNLQGPVQVTGDEDQVLTVETGLNLALTLDDGEFTELRIEAPFVEVGDVIGVIDPTGLALQADVLADLSDTVLNGVYRHRDGCNRCGCGIWAQGIGSYRKRGHEHDIVGYDNWQGGFLVGFDTSLCGGYLGLFGGATFGRAEVDEHTQRADINLYVGGVTYEGCLCNTYVGLAVALGYVDWDNDRFVMNNLAEGGVERAHADLDGFFVSPEITLARRFGCFACEPVLSFTARYAGLFFGDYSEKDSLTDLSVKDREVDLLTTRFEAAIPYCNSRGNCCLSLEPYIGVFGRYQLGGNHVDAKLLDERLDFAQGGPRNLAAFLLGFRGSQSIGCLELFLNLEASFDNESSSRILGEGGLAYRF